MTTTISTAQFHTKCTHSALAAEISPVDWRAGR